MTSPVQEKARLRQDLLNQRKAIDPKIHRELSRALAEHLHEFIERENFSKVFAFWPHAGEPDLRAVFSMNSSRIFALPVIEKRGVMVFYRFESAETLKINRFGILEPLPKDRVDPSESSLILVPALAIGRDGNRLGYGGGFYDRYLARFKSTPAVAILFEAFTGLDLPRETHDMPLSTVCTERGIVRL